MDNRKNNNKFFFFFAVLIIFAFSIIISGCASQPETLHSNSMQTGEQEQAAMQEAVETGEPGVYRSIQKQQDEVVVELSVVLPANAKYYFFEEKLPESSEIVKSDIESSGKSLKQVVIGASESRKYSYTINLPPGKHTFSGSYAIDGMENPADIKGLAEITV